MSIRVTHRLRAAGKCPANGDPDDYDVEITLRRDTPAECPMVESITPKVVALLREPVTQEQFTYALANVLGAIVTTRGRHGRFDTECTCEAE